MLPYFHYKNNALYVEEVPLADIAAEWGTPCYVYSYAALVHQWRAFKEAFSTVNHRICYAVKANSNLAILNFFVQQGAGFDIVSQGELARVLKAGGDPGKIIFSGVGKQTAELRHAIDVGTGCFDVESEAELERLQALAEQYKKTIPVALRINPDINALTHPHISTGALHNKFGVPFDKALSLCIKIQLMPYLKLIGLACHIGSQIVTLAPFLQAMARMQELVSDLQASDIFLQHINMGGGLGVQYQTETPPTIEAFVKSICDQWASSGLEIIIEPGRALVAEAGILLTRIEYLKQGHQKNFIITDAGMNDLMRPALYDAKHEILAVSRQKDTGPRLYDVVGPVCESADYLGKDRELAVGPNDLLAVLTAGAYGSSMSSNYNSRPRAAEIMVRGDEVHLIKKRERHEDLFALEQMLT